jgi:CBS domain
MRGLSGKEAAREKTTLCALAISPHRAHGVSSRIPRVPPMSSCTQSPSSSFPFVSPCVLLVPRMRDTAVTSVPRTNHGVGPATIDSVRPFAAPRWSLVKRCDQKKLRVVSRVAVEEYMTEDAVTVVRGEDANIAARRMVEHGIGHLSVIDGDSAIGMVSKGDLLAVGAVAGSHGT